MAEPTDKRGKTFRLHPDGVDPAAVPRAYTAMPWGKWKNVPLVDVPNHYLEWALHEADLVHANANLYESIKTRLLLDPHVEDYEP